MTTDGTWLCEEQIRSQLSNILVARIPQLVGGCGVGKLDLTLGRSVRGVRKGVCGCALLLHVDTSETVQPRISEVRAQHGGVGIECSERLTVPCRALEFVHRVARVVHASRGLGEVEGSVDHDAVCEQGQGGGRRGWAGAGSDDRHVSRAPTRLRGRGEGNIRGGRLGGLVGGVDVFQDNLDLEMEMGGER